MESRSPDMEWRPRLFVLAIALLAALAVTAHAAGRAQAAITQTRAAPLPPALPAPPAPLPPDASDALLYLPLAARNVELPRALLPADGQHGVSLNANLLWTLTSGAGAHYRVLFGKGEAAPSALLADNLSVLGVDAPELAPWTTYSWQVITRWPDGVETAGPVWRFTTEGKVNAPDVDAMVTVPAGTFQMGCDSTITSQYPCSWNAYHQDEPVRTIWLDAFAIDKHEVTNSEYRRCVEAGACQPPRRTTWYADATQAYTPVVFVSWWDAQDYCGWEGKRMPTEAEWEKAARGSLDTRVYPWGNQEPDCTRVYHQAIEFRCSDAPDRPQRVGLRPTGASPYGALDMAGNVFEWVRDRYDVLYYNFGPLVNPPGPATSRVSKSFGDPNQEAPRDEFYAPVFTVRGGTYSDSMHYMRVSHRHWGHHGDKPFDDSPWFRNRKVGFRCAISLP